MKMNEILARSIIVAGLAISADPAFSADIVFNPNAQGYNMLGDGTLQLWGVSQAGGSPLVANPDYGWPTTLAIADWKATLMRAQQMGMVVGVSYDPGTFDIWSIGRPYTP